MDSQILGLSFHHGREGMGKHLTSGRQRQVGKGVHFKVNQEAERVAGMSHWL